MNESAISPNIEGQTNYAVACALHKHGGNVAAMTGLYTKADESGDRNRRQAIICRPPKTISLKNKIFRDNLLLFSLDLMTCIYYSKQYPDIRPVTVFLTAVVPFPFEYRKVRITTKPRATTMERRGGGDEVGKRTIYGRQSEKET